MCQVRYRLKQAWCTPQPAAAEDGLFDLVLINAAHAEHARLLLDKLETQPIQHVYQET